MLKRKVPNLARILSTREDHAEGTAGDTRLAADDSTETPDQTHEKAAPNQSASATI
jgi:hypothetical protein